MLTERKVEHKFYSPALSCFSVREDNPETHMTEDYLKIVDPYEACISMKIKVDDIENFSQSDSIRELAFYYDFVPTEGLTTGKMKRFILFNKRKSENLCFKLHLDHTNYDKYLYPNYSFVFYLFSENKNELFKNCYLPISVTRDMLSNSLNISPDFNFILSLQKKYKFKLIVPKDFIIHPVTKEFLHKSLYIQNNFFEFIKKVLPENDYLEMRLLWEIP